MNKISQWLTGKDIKPELLYEEMVRANRLMEKISYLQELHCQHPLYIGSLPMMLIISGNNGYYGEPEKYESHLDAIISEMEELSEDEYSDSRVRLIWNGARGVDFSIFNTVDAAGGCIVGWTIAGTNKRRFDLSKEPLEAFLDVFYTMGPVGSNDVHRQCENVANLYRTRGANGVILYVSQGCSHLTIPLEVRRKYLNEKGIPTLALATTAKVGDDSGQIQTRIKAFLEMIA